MVILPSGVINVLWLMVWGAVRTAISSCSSPIHADFLVNLGRYGPRPPRPREAPSLPPSVDLRNVLFSTSAWMFATWLPPQWKKKGGQSVYQRSPEWGSRFASCFRNLLEDRRQTSNNQNTCFQTTSVFRLRSDESRDLDWDQRWFSVQTYFRGCVDTFENSLAFILESTYPPQERINIYAPFLNFCLVSLILFVM